MAEVKAGMRSIFRLLVLTLIALNCCGSASRAGDSWEDAWYVGGSLGAFLHTPTVGTITATNIFTGATTPSTETDSFDSGIISTMALGYRLPFGFRMEVEAEYAHSNLSQIVFGAPISLTRTIRDGGSRDYYGGMLNGYYDIETNLGITPYVGGGLGLLDVVVGPIKRYTDNFGNTVTFSGGSSTSNIVGMFMVQGGLSIPISTELTLDPAYRYFRSFSAANQPNFAVNIFRLGLRYSF